MGLFSSFKRKARKKVATAWLGTGWSRLQGGDYEGAIKAFNEINKLYDVSDVDSHNMPFKDLDESIVSPSFLGLTLAYAGLNNINIAKEKYAIVKTIQLFYPQMRSPEDFLQTVGYTNLFNLLERLED